MFSEAERLVELLMPHLVQAEQTHWRLGLGRQFSHAGEWQAQADEAGYLLQASPDFCQLLVREFPARPGGPLPESLRLLLVAGQGHWQGRQIEVGIDDPGRRRARQRHGALPRDAAPTHRPWA